MISYAKDLELVHIVRHHSKLTKNHKFSRSMLVNGDMAFFRCLMGTLSLHPGYLFSNSTMPLSACCPMYCPTNRSPASAASATICCSVLSFADMAAIMPKSLQASKYVAPVSRRMMPLIRSLEYPGRIASATILRMLMHSASGQSCSIAL